MERVAGLLIVVPHSVCKEGSTYCDSTSKEAAQMLLERTHPTAVEVYSAGFESNVPSLDMDKSTARNTTFRQDLSQKTLDFKTKYGDAVLLVNIHSFDPNLRPEWKDSELIIVDSRTLNDDLETVGLAQYLRTYNFQVKVVTGKSDIQDEMLGLGIKNLTLEFNQQLDNERLSVLVDAINSWIHNPAMPLEVKGLNGRAGLGLGLGLLGGFALGTLLAPRPAYYTYPPYYAQYYPSYYPPYYVAPPYYIY